MDDYNQLLLCLKGKKYKFAFPDLGQLNPLSFTMRPRVRKYIKESAMPRPIEYVVDVGACVGAFAVAYALMWPDAEVLCLEPSKHNFPFLAFNTKPFPNIRLLKIAAHNKSKVVSIASPTKLQHPHMDDDPRTGLISMYGEGDRFRESVPAEKLDDIVDKRVDWLKIDVEGNERFVLQGADRILTRDRPILQVEMKHENQLMANTSANVLLLEILKRNYKPAGAIRSDLLFIPGTNL